MDDLTEIFLEYDNGCGGPTFVSFKEPTQATILSDPFACLGADTEEDLKELPDYGDLVELESAGSDKYRFVRVVKRSKFRRFDHVVSEPTTGWESLHSMLSKAEEHGIQWERKFGGVLTVWIPLDCKHDLAGDIERLYESQDSK